MMFGDLERYKERFGDCNVHHKWKENPQLGRWVHKQRERQRNGIISAERKTRLHALGFDWDPLANKRRAG